MGWSIGYDPEWNRDIGYGVPAWCDHPKCNAEIDRGLAHVCGDSPYGGEHGCGLYFCEEHHSGSRERNEDAHNLCPRCTAYRPPYKRPKVEHPRWIDHKLKDPSWAKWRADNPEAAEILRTTGRNTA
jgi:hypothetical protein